jgi:hypothetical protein
VHVSLVQKLSPVLCTTTRAWTSTKGCAVSEPTGFEGHTLEDVLAAFLYTSEGMFGDIVFDAERELYKRIPPPEWAKKHPLPELAKEFHG